MEATSGARVQKIKRKVIVRLGDGVALQLTITCEAIVGAFDIHDSVPNLQWADGECANPPAQGIVVPNNDVTLNDVARAAGVSTKTASLVVNNKPGVNLERRMRVETAVKSLGYQPNTAARELALARRKSSVHLPDSANLLESAAPSAATLKS